MHCERENFSYLMTSFVDKPQCRNAVQEFVFCAESNTILCKWNHINFSSAKICTSVNYQNIPLKQILKFYWQALVLIKSKIKCTAEVQMEKEWKT